MGGMIAFIFEQKQKKVNYTVINIITDNSDEFVKSRIHHVLGFKC